MPRIVLCGSTVRQVHAQQPSVAAAKQQRAGAGRGMVAGAVLQLSVRAHVPARTSDLGWICVQCVESLERQRVWPSVATYSIMCATASSATVISVIAAGHVTFVSVCDVIQYGFAQFRAGFASGFAQVSRRYRGYRG